MSDVQKIIKYAAIALALFLVFSIISSIMNGVLFIGRIASDDKKVTEKLEGIDITSDVAVLNVNVVSVNVILKPGDKLLAESNNKYIDVRQDNNKLVITEAKHSWYNVDTTDLIIYIPEDIVFDGVAITTGAGKVNIDDLTTKKLYLEIGAGKVNIDKLTVLESVKIEGGAGEISLKEGNLNNLDMEIGVGKVSLTSIITGNSKIDAGVGAVNLNLIGTDDYQINLDKGIGSTTINGDDMADGSSYGDGFNIIDIEGGIGSIKINIVDAVVDTYVPNFNS